MVIDDDRERFVMDNRDSGVVRVSVVVAVVCITSGEVSAKSVSVEAEVEKVLVSGMSREMAPSYSSSKSMS